MNALEAAPLSLAAGMRRAMHALVTMLRADTIRRTGYWTRSGISRESELYDWPFLRWFDGCAARIHDATLRLR
jgi:hypothetical protein